MRISLILLIGVVLCGCGSYDARETAPETETVASEGGVAAPPAGEGESTTACEKNEDCATGAYCAKALGDCDGEGECKTRPEICTHQWDPVCGCDGKTYSNACAAAASGENVASKGECESR